MILHRFCSKDEFEAYKRGELLTNETNHSITRGSASTSIGFCWFDYDPEYAKHRLSGIVDFDICLTVETCRSNVRKSTGRYSDGNNGVVYLPEYCCIHYDNNRFKFVDATDKFNGYAPNHRDLKVLLPFLFV